MTTVIQGWLINTGVERQTAEHISYFVFAVFVLILCAAANFITKKIVITLVSKHIRKNRIDWDDLLLEAGVLRRLAHIVPVAIIRMFVEHFGPYSGFVRKGVSIYLTVVAVMVIDAVINAVDAIYRRREVSKTRPIKGLLQVLKIAVYIVAVIVALTDLMGQSPLVMLGGLGAMTAVFAGVQGFDSRLVAGIQLAANDMVRIGDWIEMPIRADGVVIDIS